jgi:hypothetical protein
MARNTARVTKPAGIEGASCDADRVLRASVLRDRLAVTASLTLDTQLLTFEHTWETLNSW